MHSGNLMSVQGLLFAIVQHQDADRAARAMIESGFKVTRISSNGGFLRTGNETLLVEIASRDIHRAIGLLSTECRTRSVMVGAESVAPAVGFRSQLMPIEVEIGGATVIVVPVEQSIHIDGRRKLFTYVPNKKGEDTLNGSSQTKLILAICPRETADAILNTLATAKYSTTLISTTGGLLRNGTATLLIGTETNRVDNAIHLVQDTCLRVMPRVNTADIEANIYVLDVQHHEAIGSAKMTVEAVQS